MSLPRLLRSFSHIQQRDGSLAALQATIEWACGRRASPTVEAPRAAATAQPSHRIEQFTFFRGQLWLSGTLGVPADSISALTLRLPDGETFPVSFEAAPAGTTFRATIRAEAPAADVARATLNVGLTSGQAFALGDLGHTPDDPAHAVMGRFLREIHGQAAGRLLEVGSRARSGTVRRDLAPAGWTYEGLDVMAGPNVDTIGDAHRIASLYPPQSFDAVMAISVLEHLLMPWKFVVELNRVLKPGALGVFTTHQCWPLHDQPWDFWRFSDHAWPALLNPVTGFEIVEARMGEPAHVIASKLHAATAFGDAPAGALASFVLFRKIGETTLSWPVDLTEVVDSHYPPTTLPMQRETVPSAL